MAKYDVLGEEFSHQGIAIDEREQPANEVARKQVDVLEDHRRILHSCWLEGGTDFWTWTPDFPRLYGRRNDSESLNRSLEDTLFLGRAHSLGASRQQVEMLGWALMVNALTLARHRAADIPAAA